ncbi:uncharacterized protein LOC122507415 [Leptopilina heterotoma]|uniref:uncharacterized protein LOC122507415 n=1 Tax=Leptopilina heterotoma TaxID=63436 RepID=UPI001CA9737D|nr:uncharacterized protein LOC122507415 [Leptopilina heterotoma]
MEVPVNKNQVKYRYKGRFIKKKNLDQIHAKSAIGKRNKGRKAVDVNNVNSMENNPSNVKEGIPDGNRIINIPHIAKEMQCKFSECGEYLSFQFIESERKEGLGSVLSIRCHKCLILNEVTTNEKYKNDKGYPVFKINTTAVLGALHVGKGHSQTAKFLSVMNIPSMSEDTFKRHERYLIPAVEQVTQQSMEVAKERKLTLENIEEVKKYLL